MVNWSSSLPKKNWALGCTHNWYGLQIGIFIKGIYTLILTCHKTFTPHHVSVFANHSHYCYVSVIYASYMVFTSFMVIHIYM